MACSDTWWDNFTPDRQLWFQLQEAQVYPGGVGAKEDEGDCAELGPKDEAADDGKQDEQAWEVLQHHTYLVKVTGLNQVLYLRTKELHPMHVRDI